MNSVRQRREIVQDNEQDNGMESQGMTKSDQMELEKLRQEVDDVLSKVRKSILL